MKYEVPSSNALQGERASGMWPLSLGMSHCPLGSLAWNKCKADRIERPSRRDRPCNRSRRTVPGKLVLTIWAKPAGVRFVSLRSGRNSDQRIAGFLIGDMQVLVAEEVKELVLDERTGERAAQQYNDAVQDFGPQQECRSCS